MKRLINTAIFGLTMLSAGAVDTVDLQGNVFRVDTVEHYVSGPGVVYTRLHLAGAPGAMDVYAVTMENNPQLHKTSLKVVLGNDSVRTTEAVSSMARRHTQAAGPRILAGTNADFFITSSFASVLPWGNAVLGYPNMSCVIDGKIAAPDIIDKVSRENALVTDGNGGLWIDATDMTYKLLNADGSVNLSMAGVNFPRGDNEIVVYNSHAGKYTKTAAGGREIAVKLADDAVWQMNKSIKCKVVGEWSTAGNMAIPADGAVISVGKDYANEWVDALTDGDVVKLKFNLKLPSFSALAPDVKNVVGGDVRLLNSGATVMEANRWINARDARNPRTMVGYSEDRAKVVLCAVDGRGASIGCSYPEGADIMRMLGCYDALDFDGGGSTAMYLSHKGIVNRTSDGSERAVGNGLFVQIDAPADNTVASLRFHDWRKTLPRYGAYRPVIYGYNKYGEIVDTDVQGVTLTCDRALGTVSADGAELLADGNGTHALTATLGQMSAQIQVSVDDNHPAAPKYSTVLLDNRKPYKAQMQALVDGEYLEVAPEAFAWSSDAEDVAEVDDYGLIRGKTDGIAHITATVGDHKAEITVVVECPQAELMPLIANDDLLADWTLKSTSIASASLSKNGNHGLSVELTTGSSTRGSAVSIVCEKRFWSHPDALEVKFNAGNLVVKSSTLYFYTANNPQQQKVEGMGTFAANADNVVTYDIASAIDTTDVGNYPVTMTSMSFALAPSTKTTYHLDIAELNMLYSDINTGGVDDVMVSPSAGSLGALAVVNGMIQLPTTASQVTVVDISGRQVSCSENVSAVAAPKQRGVYIVVATVAGKQLTAKVAI